MPVVRISCCTLVNNGSAQIPSGLYESVTNATTTAQDPVGAMKFTIAVVLVYGIGVIGLLGISARRSRRKQLMDKEVHKYIKDKFFSYASQRRRPKRTILRLISSLHNVNRAEEAENASWLKLWATPPKGGYSVPGKARRIGPHTLCRANTWSGEMERKNSDTFTNRMFGPSSRYANVDSDPTLLEGAPSESGRKIFTPGSRSATASPGTDLMMNTFTSSTEERARDKLSKCNSDQSNSVLKPVCSSLVVEKSVSFNLDEDYSENNEDISVNTNEDFSRKERTCVNNDGEISDVGRNYSRRTGCYQVSDV